MNGYIISFLNVFISKHIAILTCAPPLPLPHSTCPVIGHYKLLANPEQQQQKKKDLLKYRCEPGKEGENIILFFIHV